MNTVTEKLRRLLHRLLRPQGIIVALCAGLTVIAELYIFMGRHTSEPAAYAVYLFSAYSLVITVVWLVGVLKPKLSVHLHGVPPIHRFLTDVPFRTVVMLYFSLALGIVYAVMKFVTGIRYRSNWFIILALYYLILTVMRFLLIRGSSVSTIGQNLIREYRQYRYVGAMLLLMNIALTGIVLMYVRENSSFSYAGALIFAMAFYAFYAVIMAIRSLIVYRRHGSPLLSAAKVVSFAAALISMLALETAMLTQFGADSGAMFRHTMVAATGGGISVIFIVTAVYMIAHATRKICELRTSSL